MPKLSWYCVGNCHLPDQPKLKGTLGVRTSGTSGEPLLDARQGISDVAQGNPVATQKFGKHAFTVTQPLARQTLPAWASRIIYTHPYSFTNNFARYVLTRAQVHLHSWTLVQVPTRTHRYSLAFAIASSRAYWRHLTLSLTRTQSHAQLY